MLTIHDRVWIVDSSANGHSHICVKDFGGWDAVEQLRFTSEFQVEELAYTTKLGGLQVYLVDTGKANHFVGCHQSQPLPMLAHWLQKVAVTLKFMSDQMDGGPMSTNRGLYPNRRALQIICEVRRVCQLITEFLFAQLYGASTPGQPKHEPTGSSGGPAEDLESSFRGVE
ncbi:unnamed protein product [Calypogeia fissa]